VGCSDCTRSGGCDERKGDQRALLDDVLARVYPDRTWGTLDDEARFRSGVPRGEARRIRRALAELLRAPTFFVDGADDDLCSYVYVLCVGRRPALVELRDTPEHVSLESPNIVERYLRVALSTVGRLAAVQEVELSLAGGLIREAPRAGVYDPVLLKRLRSLTAFLASSDITYCDFGLLDRPVEDGHGEAYRERYGVEPMLANYLFYASPPTTAVLTPIVVECG
jgi:hypothetical protein